jgi:hypothetical protein
VVWTLAALVSSSVWGPWVINEEELMDARALARQGYTYAEIGRLLGRDWRTVENDGLRWPRRDGSKWAHLASVVVG